MTEEGEGTSSAEGTSDCIPLRVCGRTIGTFREWNEFGDQVFGFQGVQPTEEFECALHTRGTALRDGDTLVVDFDEGMLECVRTQGEGIAEHSDTAWTLDLVQVLHEIARSMKEGEPQ